MASDAAERLAASCRQRVGDGLRTVVEYDSDGFEVVFIREELRDVYDGSEYGELIREAVEVQEAVQRTDTESGPLGPEEATVHAFEQAFVFQFPVERSRGVIVSIDRDVGRFLGEFVNSCRVAMD